MPRIGSEIVQVCVFRFVNSKSEFLLLQRSPGETLYPNIWQFVTGRIHDGEKTQDAALRELREETGLSPVRAWIVPQVNQFFDAPSDTIHLSPFFAVQVDSLAEPVLSVEHCNYEWLSLSKAQKLLVWPGQKSGLQVVSDFILSGDKAAGLSLLKL